MNRVRVKNMWRSVVAALLTIGGCIAVWNIAIDMAMHVNGGWRGSGIIPAQASRIAYTPPVGYAVIGCVCMGVGLLRRRRALIIVAAMALVMAAVLWELSDWALVMEAI